MNTYKVFDTNFLKCNEYNEIYKYYNKNQKSNEIVNQIYDKQFNLTVLKEFLSLFTKRNSHRIFADLEDEDCLLHKQFNLSNEILYYLKVEYIIDCQMIVITEIITKHQITFVKEHVIY
jgi:hypothetical protein